MQGRADDLPSPVTDGTTAHDGSRSSSATRGRHLRRVQADPSDGWGDTDLSHLSAPPTPVTQLPTRSEPTASDPAPVADVESFRIVNKRGARHVASRLTRSETVKRMARGTVSRRKGVLVLTTQRLLFVRDRGSGASSVDFHLASVSSISIEQSTTTSRIVIHCLGVVTEVYDVPAAEAQTLVDEAQQILSYIRFPVVALKPRRVSKRPRHAEDDAPRPDPSADLAPMPAPVAAPAPAPAPVAAPAPVDDPSARLVANLRELSQLHRDGLLDDYEFAMAKAKLLT